MVQVKEGGCKYFYSCPQLDRDETGHHSTKGFKVGYHRQGPLMNTENFVVSAQGRAGVASMPHQNKSIVEEHDLEPDQHAWDATCEFVRDLLPDLAPLPVEFKRCLYQNTPDLAMILGPHPDEPRVLLCCGFSGSGFQFAPAIGEFIARCASETDATAGGTGPVAEALRMPLFCERMTAKFTPTRFWGVGGAGYVRS